MEDFGHIDLSMDLNLNLSPPSPPPQLGLGLGLSSAPLGHDDFYNQIPGLICPRFEPLISSSGFGDLEPTFVQQAAADAGRESGSSGDRALPAPEQSHFASGNSRYRWRRIRTTSAGSRAAAFPHVAVVCSGAAAELQKERHLESEEISKPAEANQCANFECNICLEMAGEPVVTLCGHLFCWPCLYQWLNVHSSSNECPVCKGEVTEKNITPIYGRGVVPTAREHDEGRMAVPPRPHAHRVESSRHRRRVSRPFSRRVEEIIRLRNGNRSAESSEGPQVQEGERVEDMIGAVSDQIVHRLRFAQRLQRGNPEDRWRLRERIIGRRSRLRSPTATDPHVMIDEVEGRMPGGLEGDEIFRDMPFGRRQRADRLAAIRTRLASMEGMLQTLTSSNPHPVASVPFQLSAASGVLVIPEYRPAEGVVGHPVFDDNTSGHGILQEELRGGGNVLEQGSVRSAHAQSRRDVQSGGAASGSLDVDGGLLHARKIRRIN